MASTTSKVIGLSAALAALGMSAAAKANQIVSTDAETSTANNAALGGSVLQMQVGDDLMNFVVGENESGMVVADHSSHASHASHSSHSSHHSGR